MRINDGSMDRLRDGGTVPVCPGYRTAFIVQIKEIYNSVFRIVSLLSDISCMYELTLY